VVRLLQAGVPMERVSALLGHTSIKVTERYYSPWVRARQEQSEADVRRSWAAPEQVVRPVAQESRKQSGQRPENSHCWSACGSRSSIGPGQAAGGVTC
jgi:hypothetical protein